MAQRRLCFASTASVSVVVAMIQIRLLLTFCLVPEWCHGGFIVSDDRYKQQHTTRSRYQHHHQRMVALTPFDFSESTVSTTIIVPEIETPKPGTTAISTTTAPATKSYVLSKEECHPIIRIGKEENERVINRFSLWCMFVSVLTFPIWILAMSLVQVGYRVSSKWDVHRSIFDSTGKLWAKTWLLLCHSYPTISGNTNPTIQPTPAVAAAAATTISPQTSSSSSSPASGCCLYVANHASWLDIPILCTVLDPVFKFIAKGELRNVPGIGQQLQGGHHILIDRDDRKSQLRTFKESMAWLQKGVPIMAFPEGMRSRDGRLMDFKKGLFSLAVKANVPIVPITLCNTNAIMPTYSFFPVQSGRGKVHVHIGQPIYPTGKTETELELLVREEFIAHLPANQLPLQLLPQN